MLTRYEISQINILGYVRQEIHLKGYAGRSILGTSADEFFFLECLNSCLRFNYLILLIICVNLGLRRCAVYIFDLNSHMT